MNARMETITLTVNTVKVEVKPGTTVLEAARMAGFEIPTMCDNAETEHFASCMVCVVKDARNGALLPACSSPAQEGTTLITDDAEVLEARKMAIELLMSEHVGDCEAPCRVACPSNMDIPVMNRLIAAGQFAEALKVVNRDIILPGVLGSICPAPCEGVCRRKVVDEAVSICLLKRFLYDAGPKPEPFEWLTNAPSVCVVGAGPAGLTAAYFLRKRGYRVDLLFKEETPGGSLRYHLPDGLLDLAVLDAEVETIRAAGVTFRPGVLVDQVQFDALVQEYDAIVLATGNFTENSHGWSLQHDEKALYADKQSYRTSMEKVFAVGNVLRSGKLAVRSAGQGKEVAFSVEQFLSGQPVIGEPVRFNSTIGRIIPDEYAEYMKRASALPRHSPNIHNTHSEPTLSASAKGSIAAKGFALDEAIAEAKRCMDCDCRKADDCLLRQHAERFRIAKKRFASSERVRVSRQLTAGMVVYEPGKCIKCGICVRLTAKYSERFGFTFIGRGFDVVVGAPLDATLDEALKETAEIVVKACPTGALGAFAPLVKQGNNR